MEKRKSNGADSGDLRASKRLKIVDKNAETAASTTKTGLEYLELIRKTSDKNGRRIATHFESLPPRRTNENYYKAVRMPISLQDVERKLDNGEFATLSELESFVKRMVINAKDFYPKNSQQYEDVERVRKSTSNFMVKHNPAYKLNHGYSAVPTPIPDELLDVEVADEDGKDSEVDEEENKDAIEDDAEAEEVEEEDSADENEEEDQDDDDDEDEDEEEAISKTPGRRKSSSARETTRAVSVGAEQDGDYEGVPYQGLTFQQAQEKIMEEIIRRPDEEDESYAYFEPFFNLPSRTLKDYFQVIKDPLSIKKLQKLVKGIRSRTDRSGVTEFKSWAAFEDKAKLLWENAYYYNEDGSVIANIAKDLEEMFRDELAQAKAVVQEPPQPKIKIKKTSATPASVRKITIHVANPRHTSTESLAHKVAVPERAASTVSRTDATPAASDKTANPARSLPEDVSPSPSVAAAKRESTVHASPTLLQRPSGSADAAGESITVRTSPPAVSEIAATAVVPPKPAVPARPAYESRFREQSRRKQCPFFRSTVEQNTLILAEPLVTNLAIKTHPALDAGDRRYEIQLPPHPKLTQRSVTLNIPAGQWRQQLYVSLNPAIQRQQRPYKMFVISNGATLGPVPLPSSPIPPPSSSSQDSATPPPPADVDKYTHLYEVNLHPGVNVVQVQLIAGLAKDQMLPNGAEAELEKITVFANMIKF
ncbi:hypothetical protein SEPCBS57363_001861 [Sporothrix epigloea]|uniref:Bromo domain-containing protein n=1 Tax=Sporothrix epigloea TaxID=1892477 RepID=A0ABP0DCL1_9PEZI